MPLHLFVCESCAQEFEALVSFKDPFPPCTVCAAPTRRLINGSPQFSLRGSGWSQDGYSCTNMGARSESAKGSRGDKVVSFPSQKVRGREGT